MLLLAVCQLGPQPGENNFGFVRRAWRQNDVHRATDEITRAASSRRMFSEERLKWISGKLCRLGVNLR